MKPLPAGGTIGVGAFASSYDMRSEVERGVEWWESRGYRVKLVLPSNVSPERKQTLRAYGAEAVWSDPGEGSDGARAAAG